MTATQQVLTDSPGSSHFSTPYPVITSRPVVVVHYVYPESSIMLCAPAIWRAPAPDAWPDIPRQLCAGCLRADRAVGFRGW